MKYTFTEEDSRGMVANPITNCALYADVRNQGDEQTSTLIVPFKADTIDEAEMILRGILTALKLTDWDECVSIRWETNLRTLDYYKEGEVLPLTIPSTDLPFSGVPVGTNSR